MTEKEGREEVKKILMECIEKESEIEAEAKKNGTWTYGLDGNRNLFKEVEAERDRKLKEISNKFK